MRRDTVNYTLVGAVVLLTIALLLAILFTMTGTRSASVNYFAHYDNVTGLGFGTPVFYQGFRIGQVSSIEPIRNKGKTNYRAALTVRRDWPIPEDSVAELTSSGLLADVAIAIREGKSDQLLKPGADIRSEWGNDIFSAVNTLASEVTVLTRDRIRPLIEVLSTRIDSITAAVDARAPTLIADAEVLLNRLNSAADAVNRVLSSQNQEHIKSLLDNLAATSANTKEISADLSNTQARLDDLLSELHGAVSDNRPELQKTVRDLSQITGSLARRIDAIAHNLESSSRNLNEFTREVRKSPQRLLFTPEADDVIVEDE